MTFTRKLVKPKLHTCDTWSRRYQHVYPQGVSPDLDPVRLKYHTENGQNQLSRNTTQRIRRQKQKDEVFISTSPSTVNCPGLLLCQSVLAHKQQKHTTVPVAQSTGFYFSICVHLCFCHILHRSLAVTWKLGFLTDCC